MNFDHYPGMSRRVTLGDWKFVPFLSIQDQHGFWWCPFLF